MEETEPVWQSLPKAHTLDADRSAPYIRLILQARSFNLLSINELVIPTAFGDLRRIFIGNRLSKDRYLTGLGSNTPCYDLEYSNCTVSVGS